MWREEEEQKNRGEGVEIFSPVARLPARERRGIKLKHGMERNGVPQRRIDATIKIRKNVINVAATYIVVINVVIFGVILVATTHPRKKTEITYVMLVGSWLSSCGVWLQQFKVN